MLGNADLQPIKGRLDRVRCFSQHGLVVQIIVQIGENRALRFHVGHKHQRLLQIEMAWMRPSAQAIDDQCVEVLEMRHARCRYGTDVRQIKRATDAEA
jgi:hypothetical protein